MQSVRRLEQGMMTVEASCILPIVCFILVLLLYFFFYCYEAGSAAGVLRVESLKLESAIKNSADLDTGSYELDMLNQRKLTYLLNYDGGKVQTQCKANIKKQQMTQSVFASGEKVEIQVSHGVVTGSISSQVKIPLIGAVRTGGFSLFSISQKVKGEVQMPAEKIRRWQQIE